VRRLPRTRFLPAGLCLALVCASAWGCGPAGPEDLAAELDAYLADLHTNSGFNGSVVVSVGDETLLAKGYGLADVELDVAVTPHTKFRIGSITKQFTAMGIMILQERGKLSVEDSLATHLSDIPAHWEGVTLHQLLTHTSGIMHSWNLPGFRETMATPATLDETLARFHDAPLLYEPGSDYAYSGVGYFILAKVIEVVSEQDYGEFLRAEIFSPAGMNDTGADRAEDILENRAGGYLREEGVLEDAPAIFMPILTGGGNLYSTAEDLVRWDRALRAGQFISPEGYEALYRPELDNYAYGWFVGEGYGYLVLRHGGGVPGFSTHIVRIPNAELCVVVLSNVQPPVPVPGQIAYQLAGMVLAGGS